MKRRRLGDLAWVVFAAVAVAVPVARWMEDRSEARERRAFEAAAGRVALQQVADLPGARLVSVRADRRGSRACGWFHLTPDVGSVPFQVLGPVEEGQTVLAVVPRLDGADPGEWADAAFSKALTLAVCDDPGREGGLPAPPPDAHDAPQADRPLRALWDRPGPEWAVFPVRAAGYVAMSRKVGGGATPSPVFPTRSEAEQWTRAEGAALARENDRRGRERLQQLDACLERPPAGDPARRAC